jgi:hypothetical protein
MNTAPIHSFLQLSWNEICNKGNKSTKILHPNDNAYCKCMLMCIMRASLLPNHYVLWLMWCKSELTTQPMAIGLQGDSNDLCERHIRYQHAYMHSAGRRRSHMLIVWECVILYGPYADTRLAAATNNNNNCHTYSWVINITGPMYTSKNNILIRCAPTHSMQIVHKFNVDHIYS